MSWWRERKYFKDVTTKIFDVDRLSKIKIPTLFAVIQAGGGAAFAYYFLEDPTYRALPYMCSVVAAVGTYNLLQIRKNAPREAKDKGRSASAFHVTPLMDRRQMRHWSVWNLATGTFTYVTNIYIFSESLKHNDNLWIPSIVISASGYYFAVSFIDNMKTNFIRNAFSNYCQLLFEPALIISTATYLLFFRNHEEDWLYWLPFVFLTTTGFKISNRRFDRVENELQPKLLLLRAMEMLTGGCLLTISGAALTIYTAVNDFNVLCVAFPAIVSLSGAFDIFGSFIYFGRFVSMDRDVVFSIIGKIAGAIAFLPFHVVLKCVQDAYMIYFICIFLAGFGHFLVLKCVLNFYQKLPNLQKENLKYTSLLSTGTVIYFANVVAFSESLKQNNKIWIIYLGIATIGYCLSSLANFRLGRLNRYEKTFSDIHAAYKYFHPLFEPTLIASTAYYLLVVQNHDKKWLRIFFLIFSVLTSLNITFDAAMRVQFNGVSLINGIELLLGGSILCINIAVLIIYAVNNQLSPIIIAVFIYLFYIGAREINASLQYLHNHVPRPVFKRYCQRVLGPVLTAYSSWASAYISNRAGWRISLAFVPFVAAGIYTTYRGWK